MTDVSVAGAFQGPASRRVLALQRGAEPEVPVCSEQPEPGTATSEGTSPRRYPLISGTQKAQEVCEQPSKPTNNNNLISPFGCTSDTFPIVSSLPFSVTKIARGKVRGPRLARGLLPRAALTLSRERELSWLERGWQTSLGGERWNRATQGFRQRELCESSRREGGAGKGGRSGTASAGCQCRRRGSGAL